MNDVIESLESAVFPWWHLTWLDSNSVPPTVGSHWNHLSFFYVQPDGFSPRPVVSPTHAWFKDLGGLSRQIWGLTPSVALSSRISPLTFQTLSWHFTHKLLLSATRVFVDWGVPRAQSHRVTGLACGSGLPRMDSWQCLPAFVSLQWLQIVVLLKNIFPNFVIFIYRRVSPTNLLHHYWKPVLCCMPFRKLFFKS